MSTEDLLEFIEARLAEDEAAARAIDVPDWRSESTWMSELIDPLPSQRRAYDGQFPLITAEDVEHIARHDPARVLREVEAKRGVLFRHVTYAARVERNGDLDLLGMPERLACDGCGWDDGRARTPTLNDCPELRALALPFADHPGYDPSWSPADE